MPKPGCSLERVIALSQLYGDEHISKNFQNRAGQGFRFYHFSTVNCAIRREIWRTFRFPEDQPVFEDIAIAKRILDAGWTIAYEPLAAVYHSHDYGAGMLFRRFFDSGVIWKQLGISDDESLQAVRSIGYQGFITKIHELRARECGIAELSRALARDLAKGVGFLLGQNERFLPISLKRRLSAFHIFS
jgi:rhamnosyltransferase